MLRSIIASVTRASASSPLQPGPEQHLVVGVVQLVGDAVEDVGEERVADVGQHHADGVGLAAHAPGRGVAAGSPARSIAWRTFARIVGLAPYALRSTFDTAVVDTLACWATSTMVIRRGGGLMADPSDSSRSTETLPRV